MSVSVGQTGEERAALYLQEHGLRIVTRNYRTKRGEIDISLTMLVHCALLKYGCVRTRALVLLLIQ